MGNAVILASAPPLTDAIRMATLRRVNKFHRRVHFRISNVNLAVRAPATLGAGHFSRDDHFIIRTTNRRNEATKKIKRERKKWTSAGAQFRGHGRRDGRCSQRL